MFVDRSFERDSGSNSRGRLPGKHGHGKSHHSSVHQQGIANRPDSGSPEFGYPPQKGVPYVGIQQPYADVDHGQGPAVYPDPKRPYSHETHFQHSPYNVSTPPSLEHIDAPKNLDMSMSHPHANPYYTSGPSSSSGQAITNQRIDPSLTTNQRRLVHNMHTHMPGFSSEDADPIQGTHSSAALTARILAGMGGVGSSGGDFAKGDYHRGEGFKSRPSMPDENNAIGSSAMASSSHFESRVKPQQGSRQSPRKSSHGGQKDKGRAMTSPKSGKTRHQVGTVSNDKKHLGTSSTRHNRHTRSPILEQDEDDESLNGDQKSRPPPLHPELRPGDTVTDPSRPNTHGCPYCDKIYHGQHARSICRRHQMSKHGIELEVQVKKSRWDNSKFGRRDFSCSTIQS